MLGVPGETSPNVDVVVNVVLCVCVCWLCHTHKHDYAERLWGALMRRVCVACVHSPRALAFACCWSIYEIGNYIHGTVINPKHTRSQTPETTALRATMNGYGRMLASLNMNGSLVVVNVPHALIAVIWSLERVSSHVCLCKIGDSCDCKIMLDN